jgi:protein phosphatase
MNQIKTRTYRREQQKERIMESYAQTDVGLKRNSNQDFVYASDHRIGALEGLLIVADGMGGQAAGDLASRLCVEAMVDTIEGAADRGCVKILAKAIRAANQAVVQRAGSDPLLEGMGTTLVAAAPENGFLYVANVGDSRLYVIDDDRIEQITHDHSLVEQMVRAGKLRPDQAKNHPKKNIITRAIGEDGNFQIDFFDVALNRGDIVLLCSDGLTNMVEDEQIFKVVHSCQTLPEAGQKLIDAANRAGGTDNISVVLAKF